MHGDGVCCDDDDVVVVTVTVQCLLLLPTKSTACSSSSCMSSLSESSSSSSSDTRPCSLRRWCCSCVISSTGAMASLRSGNGINGEVASLRSHRILFLVRLCKNGRDDDEDEAAA